MKEVILLWLAVLGYVTCDEDVFFKWHEFQVNFGKNYKSIVEANARFVIFQDNLKDIEAHNVLFENGDVSWRKGITKFTDWTTEEFLEYVNKYKTEQDPQLSVESLKGAPNPIPDFIDWRDNGLIREVKDQGQCGSCWAFSATGAIEAQLKLVKNISVSLSEQNLVDCTVKSQGYNSKGCSGGITDEAFKYAKDNGVDNEETYPYEAKDGKCRQKEHSNKISNYIQVPHEELELKLAVAVVGPISIGMEATSNLQNYAGGILYDEKCTGKINHGVLAVGYGSEYGRDYWLIKNSWGAKWGDNGYFKLSRGTNNCGVVNQASYPYILRE